MSLICLTSFRLFGAKSEPIRVNFGNGDSALHQLAKEELSAYFEKMFTYAIAETYGMGDIVIGTPTDNPIIREWVDSGFVALPDGVNSDQGFSLKTVGNSVCVAAHTSQGVLYGVYELLEQYGCYFQIYDERLPKRTRFRVKQLDIVRSPVFRYRGLLPWDNFLCGMSGYNPEDYEDLISRATRMKFNMLQFHFYPGMAFFTETWNGQMINPSFIGMPVDIFGTSNAIGGAAFGDVERFGPRPYVENLGNPSAQARESQEMIRQALAYAQQRGWKTCVGFELMYPSGGAPTYTQKPTGLNYLNPVDPHNVELSQQRYRMLVETYPESDYYWMWQSEARGFLGREVGQEPGAAEMREKYAHWTGSPNLAGDTDYAYLFKEVAQKLTPDERSRLATGGWSIEHLFPRIDAEFPEELIFASLNNYHPPSALTPSQVGSYHFARNGRRAWMIDWWEFDGDQWFPQFRASWQEQMYRMCIDYGVEAVSLLGWKLSAVEHNIRYLADFSWNPRLTADEFYKDYVTRLYGRAADSITSLYREYDECEPHSPPANSLDSRVMLLGAGWQPLGFPPFPTQESGLNEAGWKGTLEQIVAITTQHHELMKTDERSIKTFRRMIRKFDPQGRHWAQLLINRLEFRVLYVRSMVAVNQAYLVFDRIARDAGMTDAAAQASKLTAQGVALSKQAIEKYAQIILNRGDQGVVAQLNVQYYKPLLHLHAQLRRETSTYVQVDNVAFRLTPEIRFDFSQTSPWLHRDGNTSMECIDADGRPAIRVNLGGDGIQYNSVFIKQGVIDLEKTPIVDFWIRVQQPGSFALLFQSATGEEWYALNLIGKQGLYTNADVLPSRSLSDGQWHRITWDIARLCEDTMISSQVIRNLLLGAWENPSEPIIVDFRDFSLGLRNLLD